MPIQAIGPGPESVAILLYAAPPTAGRWDTTKWDGGNWYASGWQSVGCDVGELEAKWGASQESGILSIAEAGELDLRTIDPDRELDPLNTSSPYYGAVKPGTAIRVVGYAPAAQAVATAFIDEVTYDLASARGRIRAIDGIAYLSQAQVPAGTVLPDTLRARVRAIVSAVGLGAVVPVQPEPANTDRLYEGGAEGFPDAYTTLPPGWALLSGTGTLGTSSGRPRTGSRAYNARGTVQAGGVSVPTQRVVGGATYTFTGWRNRENFATGTLSASLNMFRADGTFISQAVGTLDWAAGLAADTWITRTVQVTFPAECDYVLLILTPNAAGSDWIDDLSLVGPNPDTVLEPDPPVAPYDTSKAQPAWAAISDAAQDALTYVWLDPTGTLRFRSWGSLIDAPINVGCPPADADPGDLWLEGVSTLESTASGDAVRNRVRAYTTGTTWSTPTDDAVSIAKYGPRPFDVPRVVPALSTFASRVLADRSDAGLEVAVGEVRPYTQAELAGLLSTGLLGPSTIRVRDDAHGELIDLDLAMIGQHIGMTPAGWRFGLVTFLSRVSWDAIAPEPPVPPIPPAGTFHVETRQYIATSDALIALTSGGAKYGAGASSTLPVGVWSGWTYRSLLAFPAIPWTKVRAIRSATLKVQSTTAVRVGMGSSPKTQLLRITSSWSAGSSTTPGSGNAVVWPGPNTTSSGAVTVALAKGANANNSLRCDAIVTAWAPSAIGGSGAAQNGIELREASGSTSNTGEVWPVEKGGAARPLLELVVEVYD